MTLYKINRLEATLEDLKRFNTNTLEGWELGNMFLNWRTPEKIEQHLLKEIHLIGLHQMVDNDLRFTKDIEVLNLSIHDETLLRGYFIRKVGVLFEIVKNDTFKFDKMSVKMQNRIIEKLTHYMPEYFLEKAKTDIHEEDESNKSESYRFDEDISFEQLYKIVLVNQKLLSFPIENLNLAAATIRMLKRNNIHYLKDLVQLELFPSSNVRNTFGNEWTCLSEIRGMGVKIEYEVLFAIYQIGCLFHDAAITLMSFGYYPSTENISFEELLNLLEIEKEYRNNNEKKYSRRTL